MAAETGVPRDQLTIAEKVTKADPKIAEKVKQGELSLKEATEKTGVVIKKAKKPSPTAALIPAKKLVKTKSKPDQSQWKDEFTEVIDRPDDNDRLCSADGTEQPRLALSLVGRLSLRSMCPPRTRILYHARGDSKASLSDSEPPSI